VNENDEPGTDVAVAESTEMITLRPGTPAEPEYTDVDHSMSADTLQALADATPANTTRAYVRAWEDFAGWCVMERRVILPATHHTLTEYARTLITADRSPSTVKQAIGVIRAYHRDSGYPRRPGAAGALKLLKAYRKKRSDAGLHIKKRPPMSLPALRAIVATCDPETTAGTRDRALILVGFAMMARRSELAARNLSDVTDNGEDGLRIRIGYSKTDQDADGATVSVPYGDHPATCPVRALENWTRLLAGRGITEGPLFRPVDREGRLGGEDGFSGKSRDRLTGQGIDKIIQRRALLAGIKNAPDYGSHSLRSGPASAAYAAGMPVSEIARHGRWAPNSPVVLGYIRAVDGDKHNPMKGIGL
jgi:integrase